MTTHTYAASLRWSGETSDYRTYNRTHEVTVAAGAVRLSSDPAFLGDPGLMNPEQLLVMAASSCQLLSFLAVAARSGVVVETYTDEATGVMPQDDSPTRITQITLRPRVRVRGADSARVQRLLHKAHEQCYIANSLTTEIVIEPSIDVVSA